jgi:hypothetical protein
VIDWADTKKRRIGSHIRYRDNIIRRLTQKPGIVECTILCGRRDDIDAKTKEVVSDFNQQSIFKNGSFRTEIRTYDVLLDFAAKPPASGELD